MGTCPTINCPYRSWVQLDSIILGSMDLVERSFWFGFLEEAYRTTEKKEAEGERRPFEPPDFLREKYKIALEKYEGEIYCQIQELRNIFSF